MSMDRREFVVGSLASGLALGAGACIPPDQSPLGRLIASLRLIEAGASGSLGAELFDTESGLSIGHNRNTRFGHCSSFKLSLAAMMMARDAAGLDSLDRHIMWSEDDLMFVSPFTTQRLAEGATIGELAEATQRFSDNAAANVLLREIGGPDELTGFWRSIGDQVSRLDRTEPALNNVPPGEVRDTSTPAAMARTVAKLAYGNVLPEKHRTTLQQWMVDTTTGSRRVRASIPESWRAGDKTGTGLPPGTGGTYVDIGFVEAPGRAPITFATYFRPAGTDSSFSRAHEAVLAQVGEVLTEFASLSA